MAKCKETGRKKAVPATYAGTAFANTENNTLRA
jgi:hypothetical protein